jgi:hypothetical protein
MLRTVLYECRLFIILALACWLYGVATFLRLILTGKSHLLDKKLEEFLTDFPDLAVATGSIMAITTLLIPQICVRFIYRALLM